MGRDGSKNKKDENLPTVGITRKRMTRKAAEINGTATQAWNRRYGRKTKVKAITEAPSSYIILNVILQKAHLAFTQNAACFLQSFV